MADLFHHGGIGFADRGLGHGRAQPAGQHHGHLHSGMGVTGRLARAIDRVLERVDAVLDIHGGFQIAVLHTSE